MENILHDILKTLEANAALLGLSYIDEDFGQLESLDNETDCYPLTFPAVLVSVDNVVWENTGQRNQTGNATITVRLLVDCYDDTHAGSTTIEDVLRRCALNRGLTDLLHGLRVCENNGMLTRVSSRTYNAPHLIKVYESVYSCVVWEKFDGSQTTALQNIRITPVS